MEEDELRRQAQAIEACIAPLQVAIKDVELLSRRIPAAEDFHYYSNFSNFRGPVASMNARAQALLSEIGTCKKLRSEASAWPADVEESYDWLVGVQDDVLEGVGSALDELGLGAGKRPPDFLLRKGKKKNAPFASGNASESKSSTTSQRAVKVASQKKERLPVPFHVRSLPRPQDKFDYPADNSNSPFKHLSREVLLGRSQAMAMEETGSAKPQSALELHAKSLGLMETPAVHPLKEELTSMEYMKEFPADGPDEPVKPKSLSETPLFIVESLPALETMAAKLRASSEIAVDLENHHYRSFQGFVCLMQVSTRSQDFIVDTLVLRSHIGPVLRSVFANPSIRKVIHGSDRDILWLQRDFGIYVCNLFDTGQAARVLRMERFGLAFLLQTFCEVTPDKRYQLADWRLRPLSAEMLKYAREDTHYLLYVYDKMKGLLRDAETTEDLYLEVCQRSRDLCLQLYEKELFTESSFLHIYGLAEKNLTPEKLAIVAGLYAWRDKLCRSEDESTGYILPNSLLFRLAEDAPQDVKRLQGILRRGHPVAAFHSAALLKVIRDAAKTVVTQQPVPVPEPSKPEEVEEGEINDTMVPTSPAATEHFVQQLDVVTTVKTVPSVPEGTSLAVFDEPGFETVEEALETSAAKLQQETVPTMQVKRSSVADALFRASSAHLDSDEDDDEEAMAKALAIRASLSFPSVKAVPMEEQQIVPDGKTSSVAALEICSPVVEVTGPVSNLEEVILLEDGDNETKDTTGVDQAGADQGDEDGTPATRDPGASELPLSLNERYGGSGKQQQNRKRERMRKGRKRASDSATGDAGAKDEAEVTPFSVKRDKREPHFDPAVSAEPKLNGVLQGGKRRTVFPKSGNRTAIFK
ncbi:protein RRP6-like 1 [Selaginella moellendorffii]|uniref:protein RRP6-like 1 n=1 Tax=Selaginella moellendorffii TaxID=88036 RepID=UPI000D1CCD9D|nr:protein RRP6-like 1 [Selaginella moellendorffii]|eukprot:XP_024526441.1 protein RRP6-like 1 [Selaginella moellendorffii]